MAAFVAQGSNILHMFIRQHHCCRRTFWSSCLRQSHYETLGVPRTATSGQIKTSFYRLSQQYHPDINKEPGAREKFQKISGAWAVLKDGRHKREYDKSLRQGGSASSSANTQYPSGSYYDPTEWSSHSRRHTRQSAEWAWSYSYRTSAGNSAFRRPRRANDPFSNPHVQRATGKTRTDNSASFWYSDSGSHSGWGKRKSTASMRAEEQHAREAEANQQTGLWNVFPTIGVTLLFLLIAHGSIKA